jgi:hypothetical protein
MDPLSVAGLAVAVVGVLVTIILYQRSVARSPKVYFEGNGILCRCLTSPAYHDGWGITPVKGKMRTSHKQVTVVDAELYYKMDKKHVRSSSKIMGKGFPPLHKFVRVANDQQGSIGALTRQSFTPVKLMPGEGEQSVSVEFALGGNFAEEYSKDFFSGALSSLRRHVYSYDDPFPVRTQREVLLDKKVQHAGCPIRQPRVDAGGSEVDCRKWWCG